MPSLSSLSKGAAKLACASLDACLGFAAGAPGLDAGFVAARRFDCLPIARVCGARGTLPVRCSKLSADEPAKLDFSKQECGLKSRCAAYVRRGWAEARCGAPGWAPVRAAAERAQARSEVGLAGWTLPSLGGKVLAQKNCAVLRAHSLRSRVLCACTRSVQAYSIFWSSAYRLGRVRAE